jgi:biopolymer transport protein ExbD
MAEFQSKGKSNPRVDMTPMVDLGFLLITFFMLATSFADKKIIKIDAPAIPPDKTLNRNMKCSQSLTLLLTEDDKVKYYICPESGQPDSVDFSKTGLRQLIVKRQQEVLQQWGKEKPLIVLIKAMPHSKYKRMIDVIDEMNITQALFTMAELDNTDSTVFKLR